MPTTILKIEHGTVDGRGRFRPGSHAPAPLGRTVTRVGKANPFDSPTLKEAKERWKYTRTVLSDWLAKDFRKGTTWTTWNGYPAVKSHSGHILVFEKDRQGHIFSSHRATPLKGATNPASLKALLGSGQWRKVKVRPLGEGKVQVLLTTGKGKGVGRRTPNPRLETLYNRGYSDRNWRMKGDGTRDQLFHKAMDSEYGKGWVKRFTGPVIAEMKRSYNEGYREGGRRSPNPPSPSRRGALSGKRTGRGNPATISESRIRSAFANLVGRLRGLRIVHEHGQYWVDQPSTGAQWSVEEASGPGSYKGLAFEQVSEGREEY